MSRLNPLSPPYEKKLQAQFDQIMPKGMPPLLLFRTIATSNRAWNKFSNASLLDKGPLSLRYRELVINRICARTGCEYEWGVHIRGFAQAANLTDEEITATISVDEEVTCWTGAEAVLIATIDALHDRSTLSDTEYTNLSDHFSDDEILEILLLAGFYTTVSYICNGLNLPLEEGAARFSDYRD